MVSGQKRFLALQPSKVRLGTPPLSPWFIRENGVVLQKILLECSGLSVNLKNISVDSQ